MATPKEIRASIRDLKRDMKERGIRRTSCMNGGLDRETWRCNARLFQLSLDLENAEKANPPRNTENLRRERHMPRTETVERTLFTFDELNDRAKEAAREWFRAGNLDHEWWDATYEDAEQCAKILGIEFDRKRGDISPAIWFSGFASQGDGACFDGHYAYAKGAAKLIRQHAPQDTELHRIASDLQTLQRAHLYRLAARTRHRGHYYHSGCMTVEVWTTRDGGDVAAATEEALTQLLRDFADWIYRQLEREHDYQQSDKQVDESIRANAYEFTEQGKIA